MADSIRNGRTLARLAVGLVAVGLVGAGGYVYLSTVEETPISHHWQGYESWYRTSGPEPITGDATRFLGGRHRGTEGYRVIYVNPVGQRVNRGLGPYDYPSGTVIVKEQYANRQRFEAGKRPELNVMIKLADGASPETGDWGYVSGFRRKIHQGGSGTAEFCGDCHKAANLRRNDYVFINASSHPVP